MLTVTFCPLSVVETMTALNESEAPHPGPRRLSVLNA
jgi:hypothetical protein